MIKRYCDRCGQQIDEGVHAWYVLELHGTDGEFRHKELCEECYEYLCEKGEVPIADRRFYEPKDEPRTDIITFTYTEEEWNEIQDWKDRMWAEAVIEPQTDRKTENSSEKPNNCEDEPQKHCYTCETSECFTCKDYSNWQSKTEQTEREGE